MASRSADRQARSIFIVAGEASGDELGARLMEALRRQAPSCTITGVGGPAMIDRGLESLFPLADIAVMGILPVLARLPSLLARIRETAAAVVASRPDVLVIIDSPDFTHRVARKVRVAAPGIPIIDYVSPTVWAWRPGRAKRMHGYVDHLLALLPFEPEAHQRLGGPPCTYVGHPLVERFPAGVAVPAETHAAGQPLVLVLPGSRHAEISRLMGPFGETIARIAAVRPDLRFALPAVPHVRPAILDALGCWPVKPEIVDDERRKAEVFGNATAALAASGTVTLELALARVPMVAAYRGSPIEKAVFDRMVKLDTVLLPNLIVGRRFVPELLQEACTPEQLSAALLPLLSEGPERRAQLEGFAQLRSAMTVEGDDPSHLAARIVLDMAERGRAAP